MCIFATFLYVLQSVRITISVRFLDFFLQVLCDEIGNSRPDIMFFMKL